MMAWIERPFSEAVGSKVNLRFHNRVGYCIEHVFELLFFLQGAGISNFFGILGCKVLGNRQRKTVALPVRWDLNFEVQCRMWQMLKHLETS